MKKTWTVWYHGATTKTVKGIEADTEREAITKVQHELARLARQMGVGCPTAERAELESNVQEEMFA
jgi:hypothetical protein